MQESSETQTIIAKRTGGGSSQALEIPFEKKDKLGEGFFGQVYGILARIRERKTPLRFAYKFFDYPDRKRIAAAIAIHDRLIRLPHGHEYTIPTFRSTQNGLLMTDLSDSGKNIVLSPNDSSSTVLQRIEKITNSHPDFARSFVETDMLEDNWNIHFREKAEMIAHETSEAHISISGDSIFFVLYPGGSYKLYIVDLDDVKLFNNVFPDDLYAQNLKAVMDMQPFITSLWLELLKSSKNRVLY